ncbi:hypothetical protein SLE2022_227690 [Rubroshorea leprosula]
MASSMIFFITFATFVAFIPSILATEHEVGDGNGWHLNFDYQAWAATKEFWVGDTFVFKYPQGAHKEPTMCSELMELHFSNVQHQLKHRPLPLEMMW